MQFFDRGPSHLMEKRKKKSIVQYTRTAQYHVQFLVLLDDY
jgi:hypothetical protein